MNPIQDFDPIANPKGTIVTNGVNRGEQIVFYNGSIACLKLTFADKTIDYLPPQWTKSWKKESPMGVISYETFFTVVIQGQPFSKLFGTVYEPGEHVLDTNGPFSFTTIIGNPGAIAVSGTNTLVNTGGPANLPIITVGSIESGTNTFTLTNDGLFTVAPTLNGTSPTLAIKTLEPASTGLTILQLGSFNYYVEIMDGFVVDGHCHIIGSVNTDTDVNIGGNANVTGSMQFPSGGVHIKNSAVPLEVFGDTGGPIRITGYSGTKVYIRVGSTDVFSIDGSGNAIFKGTVTQNGTP